MGLQPLHFGRKQLYILMVLAAAGRIRWHIWRAQAAQLGMRRAVPIHRQLLLGLQVVVGEHVQVGLQCARGALLARQLQAQGGDLGGA